MNRTHTILVITVLTAGVVGWQILERADRNDPATDIPRDGQSLQSAESPPYLLRHQTEGNSPGGDTDSHPPTADGAPVWFVRRDNTDCNGQTVFIPDARTGDLIEATDCAEPKETDVYEDLDDETLADLAYGDSHAAEVLGLRLILSDKPENEAMGLGLLYRSVALSGDAETFQKAIGSRYAYLSVNGKPQVRHLKQLLVFNLIGEVLGDSGFDSKRIVRALQDADVEQQEIDAVRSGTRTILQRMADLQTEVTGNMSIREALENA